MNILGFDIFTISNVAKPILSTKQMANISTYYLST